MEEGRLVDFERLGARLRRAAAGVLSLVLAGAVAAAVRDGLTVRLVATWVSVAVAGLVLVGVVLVALSAAQGASEAQRRGERLAGDDVGLRPPRRRKTP